MATTYEPIATTTLTSEQTTVTFSTISGSYTDLILVCDGNAYSNSITLRFNNDSGSNYSDTRIYGDGTSIVSDRHTNQTSIAFISGTVNSATLRANLIAQIQNYANSTTYKTALLRSNSSSLYVMGHVGLWRNTAAITRIDVICGTNFRIGSTFTLYGIASA